MYAISKEILLFKENALKYPNKKESHEKVEKGILSSHGTWERDFVVVNLLQNPSANSDKVVTNILNAVASMHVWFAELKGKPRSSI